MQERHENIRLMKMLENMDLENHNFDLEDEEDSKVKWGQIKRGRYEPWKDLKHLNIRMSVSM